MVKAQTATEFIILAVILLAAAAFVVSISMSRQDPNTATIIDEYWLNADIGILSYQANTTHMRLHLRNNLPYTITLTEIKLNEQRTNYNVTLAPGEQIIRYPHFIHDSITSGAQYTAMPEFTYQTETGVELPYFGQQPLKNSVTRGPLP